MKAIQIDFVRKMLEKAMDSDGSPRKQTPDEIISSFPEAVEEMTSTVRYETIRHQNELNEKKVSLLLDVIKELG